MFSRRLTRRYLCQKFGGRKKKLIAFFKIAYARNFGKVAEEIRKREV